MSGIGCDPLRWPERIHPAMALLPVAPPMPGRDNRIATWSSGRLRPRRVGPHLNSKGRTPSRLMTPEDRKIRGTAEAKLGCLWHARRLLIGTPSPKSICRLLHWSAHRDLSGRYPNRSAIRNRAVAESRIPHGLEMTILWEKNVLETTSRCVVCGEHAASHMAGAHAVLFRSYGSDVVKKLVAIHARCAPEGEPLPTNQGYGWEFSP